MFDEGGHFLYLWNSSTGQAQDVFYTPCRGVLNPYSITKAEAGAQECTNLCVMVGINISLVSTNEQYYDSSAMQACWMAEYLSRPTASRLSPPACVRKDGQVVVDSSYLFGSSHGWMCKDDQCGRVMGEESQTQSYAWGIASRTFRYFGLDLIALHDQSFWDDVLPGCWALARFDVAPDTPALAVCVQSCRDQGFGGLQCVADFFGPSERLHAVCFKARTASATRALAWAKPIIITGYVANSVTCALLSQVKGHHEKDEFCEAVVTVGFPFNQFLAERMNAARFGRFVTIQAGAAMLADPYSDLSAVLEFLTCGQPTYAGLMCGAFTVTGDPFQVQGLRALRESLLMGYLTPDLVKDKGNEAYYEGLPGFAITAMALYFLSLVGRGEPPPVAVLNLLFTMATSCYSLFGMAECLFLRVGLEQCGSKGALVQKVLLKLFDGQGLLWPKALLPVQALALLPLAGLACTDFRSDPLFKYVMAMLMVLPAMTLLMHCAPPMSRCRRTAVVVFSTWMGVESFCVGLWVCWLVPYYQAAASPARELKWFGAALTWALMAVGTVASLALPFVSALAADAHVRLNHLVESLEPGCLEEVLHGGAPSAATSASSSTEELQFQDHSGTTLVKLLLLQFLGVFPVLTIPLHFAPPKRCCVRVATIALNSILAVCGLACCGTAIWRIWESVGPGSSDSLSMKCIGILLTIMLANVAVPIMSYWAVNKLAALAEMDEAAVAAAWKGRIKGLLVDTYQQSVAKEGEGEEIAGWAVPLFERLDRMDEAFASEGFVSTEESEEGSSIALPQPERYDERALLLTSDEP